MNNGRSSLESIEWQIFPDIKDSPEYYGWFKLWFRLSQFFFISQVPFVSFLKFFGIVPSVIS